MAAERAAGRRLRRATARSSAARKSGAANIRTDLTGARANIVEAARLAFVDAGLDPDLIAADAGRARPRRQPMSAPIAQQLEAILPFRAQRASRPTR